MATSPSRTPRLAPAERRAQLLDAALDVLAEGGFDAVTIEAVAQRAGVTRPVLYDQFGDLQGLMIALMDTAEHTALAPLLEIVDVKPGDDVDPEQFLFDSVLAFLQAVRSDPRTWRLVLMPPRGSRGELRERIRRSRRLVADRVTELLDWGVPLRGGPLGLDHELAARVIVAAGEDAARLMLAHPRRFTPDRLGRMTVDFLTLIPPGPSANHYPRPDLRGALPPVQTHGPMSPTRQPSQRMPQSQRREQLLDVTLELLAEAGFGALSMEAIARRAGVNRAVVYRSFANLGVLLLALLHREDRRIARTLDQLLPRSLDGSPGEILGGVLARFLEAALQAPARWRVALLRPESAPIALQKVVNRRRSSLAQQLEPLVRWGLDLPGMPVVSNDLETLARMLLSVGEELARLVLDDPEFPLERIVEGSWALLDYLAGPA
ncbi:MAG: TetR/AcrR family transcriptional regulator [Solirubrobacteraceae bacterium]